MSFEIAYKECAVPCCNSNTVNCPNKIYVQVPIEPSVRQVWFQRANVRQDWRTDRRLQMYFCEDHFEIKNGGWLIQLPSRFECQCLSDDAVDYSDPSCSYTNPFRTANISSCASNIKNTEIRVYLPGTPEMNGLCLIVKTEALSVMVKQYYASTKTPSLPEPITKMTKCGLNKYKKASYTCGGESNINNIPNWVRNDEEFKEPRSFDSVETESTESANSFQTIKCNLCELEFIQERDLLNHFVEAHQSDNYEGNHYYDIDGHTESLESCGTFKCYYCGIEFVHEQDLNIHTLDQHLDIEDNTITDNTLDIKPEIFQCNKCPCSFVNEEDMSKHLQIMHQDLTNYGKHIKKLTNTAKMLKDRYNENNIEAYRKTNNTSLRCENDVPDCNFTEFETNVEIKREYGDDLENETQDLGQILYENQFTSNKHSANWPSDNAPLPIEISRVESLKFKNNIFEPRKIDNSTNKHEFDLNKDYANIDKSLNESCSYQHRYLEYLSTVNAPSSIIPFIPQVVQCKGCKKRFISQEELLDHIHDLVNTKAKLYADAKKVLKTTSVKFKNPLAVPGGDTFKQYLSEADMLEYIHQAYNIKPRTRKVRLQVVKYMGDEESCTFKSLLSDTLCRCCFKPLSNSIIKKQGKICNKCRRKTNHEGRKFSTAKLYASAKNMQLQSQEKIPDHGCKQPFLVCTRQNQAGLQKNNDICDISNRPPSSPSKPKEKLLIENDDPFSLENNDLLTPVREENETVLVQPSDSKVCKAPKRRRRRRGKTNWKNNKNRKLRKCNNNETQREEIRKQYEVNQTTPDKGQQTETRRNSVEEIEKQIMSICQRQLVIQLNRLKKKINI